MNDTFVVAPALVLGYSVAVVIFLVIAGVTIARYIVYRMDGS